jgi:hypothetical protein
MPTKDVRAHVGNERETTSLDRVGLVFLKLAHRRDQEPFIVGDGAARFPGQRKERSTRDRELRF